MTLLVIINIAFIMYLVLHTLGISMHSIHRMRDKKRRRQDNLNALINDGDIACKNELRMNRKTFYTLCEMVRDKGGLRGTRNMSVEEILAMFLYTLAHHKKTGQ